MWIRERTTELGAERAEYWGWTNIYTYSKSLAEQIIAQQDDIVKILVRPSIVESSQQYPFPGWNEGFTTSAPLVFASLKGQRSLLAREQVILDIIPVDHVAGDVDRRVEPGDEQQDDRGQAGEQLSAVEGLLVERVDHYRNPWDHFAPCDQTRTRPAAAG